MKPSLPVLAFVAAAALSSCTAAYKSGQTPDDVYFSPERPQAEYVTTNTDENRYYGEDYYSDRYLRMKVRDRALWSQLDDPYYFGSPYSYSYYNNYYLGNPWNPYMYWNYYYNPYYTPWVIVNPKTSYVYSRPRMYNLGTYNNAQLTRGNYSTRKFSMTLPNTNQAPNRYYNYQRSGSNAGGFLRNAFGGNNGNPGSGSRSFSSPGSSSSSGSRSGGGGGGGGSAPVRRF
ncbi:MAG TPA: hypothetical protein VG870_00880 [Chitinophagaceae bacterium]|nr:hypothetical protein [Chitinophagaceae bacterium]